MALTIEDLLAQAEIRNLHLQYCRAADRMDQALFRACFHDDATFAFPVYTGPIEGFLTMAWATLNAFVATRHVVGNQFVEVHGDRAFAEHYTVATHRMAASESGPARDFIAQVRYLDRVERRDGAWRIAHRMLLTDLSRTDAISDLAPPPRDPDGSRDASDPSYAMLQAIREN